MPSNEDIFKQFQEAVVEDPTFGKDPVTVDVIMQGLRDISLEPDPVKCAQKSFDLMRTYDIPEVGTSVCSLLLNRPDGQKLCCEVGRQVMQVEVNKPEMDPNSFLRSSHGINGFTKQFLQQTSPDYEKTIRDKVSQIGSKYDLTTINKSDDDFLKKNTGVSLGKDFVSVLTETPLSPESVQFLKVLGECALTDDPGYTQNLKNRTGKDGGELDIEKQIMSERIINNASILRFGTPAITNNPNFQARTPWNLALERVQRTINSHRQDTLDGAKDSTDLTRGITAGIHTEENRAKFRDFQEGIKNAPDPDSLDMDLDKNYRESVDERNLLTEARIKEAQPRVIAQQKERAQELMDAKAKPEMEKLAQLESKLDRLKNNPTFGDRFKAFFQGGMEKARERVIDEIDRTKTQIAQKVMSVPEFRRLDELNNNSVSKLKEGMSELEVGAEKYKIANARLEEIEKTLGLNEGLRASGLGSPLTDEQVEDLKAQREVALGDMRVNRPAWEQHQQLGSELQGIEKNKSVREAIGVEARQARQAQKQGVGQGV